MKKIKSILNAKLMLTIAFMSVSTSGFSQTTNANFEGEENSKEVKFDFMGTDLSTQSAPQLNGWKNISENSQFPELKSAEFNHSRLDSIRDMINYGNYAEHSKWFFSYDENNILTTSERRFLDASNEYRDKKETRMYNQDGHVISVVRTEYDFKTNTITTSYREDNQYANGNLIYQLKIESYFINRTLPPTLSTNSKTQYSYNEKNQLVKAVAVSSTLSKNLTTEYFYEQEGRRKYIISKQSSGSGSSRVTKYDYLFSDTTLLIKEKSVQNASKSLTLSDLEKISNWNENYTFTLSLDQYGRTKSIEKTTTNKNPTNQKFAYYFKMDYDYTPSGKQKQATFYLPVDPYNPATYYASTIIKNTYDEQDNLLQYEKMFYNSVLNEWVDEELQTYYYSSVKSALTSNNQQKTDDFQIYPNPASEVIYLSASPEPGTSYAIYNSVGVLVSQGLLKSPSIQVSQLKPGIYFLKTIGTNAVSEFRFIKN